MRRFGGQSMEGRMTLELIADLALSIAIVLGFFPLCGIMARHVSDDELDGDWP